jgi:hypothetical protein
MQNPWGYGPFPPFPMYPPMPQQNKEKPFWKQLRDYERWQDTKEERKKKSGGDNKPKSPTYTFWQAFSFCVTFGLPIAFVQLLLGYGIVKLILQIFGGIR